MKNFLFRKLGQKSTYVGAGMVVYAIMGMLSTGELDATAVSAGLGLILTEA